MCAKIAKNNTIKLEVYKKLVPELKVIIGTINTDEIDKERLKILVSNKMLAFNTNNFSVIAKELIEF